MCSSQGSAQGSGSTPSYIGHSTHSRKDKWINSADRNSMRERLTSNTWDFICFHQHNPSNEKVTSRSRCGRRETSFFRELQVSCGDSYKRAPCFCQTWTSRKVLEGSFKTCLFTKGSSYRIIRHPSKLTSVRRSLIEFLIALGSFITLVYQTQAPFEWHRDTKVVRHGAVPGGAPDRGIEEVVLNRVHLHRKWRTRGGLQK